MRSRATRVAISSEPLLGSVTGSRPMAQPDPPATAVLKPNLAAIIYSFLTTAPGRIAQSSCASSRNSKMSFRCLSPTDPRPKAGPIPGGIDDLQPSADGTFRLHQVYKAADGDYSGKVTVPTLWDRERRTIVNNESSEIIRMLNSAFAMWTDVKYDFYPEGLRHEIDSINDFVYEHLNNGVYRAGFARSQQAYEEAARKVFHGLDTLDERLGRTRYLAGERITETDWRAFPTLLRFDLVYYSHFKCNLRRIQDYRHLVEYLRELYQWPGIRETFDLQKIKAGYYSQRNINPTGIVPIGPDLAHLEQPHKRGSNVSI